MVTHAQNYTVTELIDCALKNNVDIQKASLNLQSSQMELYSSRVNFLPDVAASAGYRQDLQNDLPNVSDTDYSMSFTISKNFTLNNADYYDNRFAKHEVNSQQITYEKTKQDIFYSLICKYVDVPEQQKQYEFQQEYLKIQEGILVERQTQYQLRKITQYDLQQSEIDLLNTQTLQCIRLSCVRYISLHPVTLSLESQKNFFTKKPPFLKFTQKYQGVIYGKAWHSLSGQAPRYCLTQC